MFRKQLLRGEKMWKKYETIFIYCVLFLILFPSKIRLSNSEVIAELSQTDNLNQNSYPKMNKMKTELIPHQSIIILSDEDFITQGFPGEGTPSDPYQIENYDITTTFGIGMYVFNTTKSFTISNCFISALDWGIVITDIISGTAIIENNTCINHNYDGIYVWGSSQVYLRQNECYGNRNGIATDRGEYLEIKKNYCHDNRNGIRLLYSEHSKVMDNTLELNHDGIDTYYVKNTIFERNVIVDYGYSGISMWWGKHNRVENNYCTRGVFGIVVNMSQNISIIENECSKNNQDGIYSNEMDDSLILDNFFTKNNESGIRIARCSKGTVANNTCTENKDAGIFTYYGSFTSLTPPIIEDNVCKNNTIGMRVWETHHAIIRNNTCESNGQGILLVDSKYIEIVNNTLLRNRKYGVKIATLLSTWNVIHHNYFICNNLNGTEDGYSQAFDDSYNNKWYDDDSSTGNFWTDYEGEGEYSIDGKYNMTDPYPSVYNYDCQVTSETTAEPTEESFFSVLIVLLSFLGITITAKTRHRRFWK